MHYLIIRNSGELEIVEAESLGDAGRTHLKEDGERLLPYKGFKEGDRVHGGNYVRDFGTVKRVSTPVREILSCGDPTGHYDQWYEVHFDNKGTYDMNDGGTHPMGWEWGRIIPASVAPRYGFGKDPKVMA